MGAQAEVREEREQRKAMREEYQKTGDKTLLAALKGAKTPSTIASGAQTPKSLASGMMIDGIGNRK